MISTGHSTRQREKFGLITQTEIGPEYYVFTLFYFSVSVYLF